MIYADGVITEGVDKKPISIKVKSLSTNVDPTLVEPPKDFIDLTQAYQNKNTNFVTTVGNS